MRLFIASPAVLEDFTAVRERFSDSIKGKWVEEENLHLTWVFLGEVPDPKPFIEVFAALSPLFDKVPVRGLGYFGRPPRLLYAGVRSRVLFDKLAAFEQTGLKIERFKPHITLCRIKKVADRNLFGSEVKRYKNRTLGYLLPEIALYESRLTEKGAVYRKLCTTL